MLKKLLFIGHSYHKKTNSSKFMEELLKKEYEIEYIFYNPYEDDINSVFNLKYDVDVLLCWQIIPPIKLIKKCVKFKRGILFPMYDNSYLAPLSFWHDYKNFNIINFSKTLHEKLKSSGFSSFYIQYFPKPIKDVNNLGDEKSIFFWQRLTDLNVNIIDDILDLNSFKHIHLHKALDPSQKYIEPKSSISTKISYSDWYENKEDMIKDIKDSAIYIAPRFYEGIGMSFLEAMAMGRCVIACDNPTMNEYITNGKTGYLFNMDRLERINLMNVRDIQKNTIEYIQNGYTKWENEKFVILEWIQKKPSVSFKLLMLSFQKTISNVFSIKNQFTPTHKQKVVTILGLKIKGKKKRY